MNENPVNDAQADRQTIDDEIAHEGMADGKQAEGEGDSGPDAEKLRRIRLNGFLRELVRQRRAGRRLPGCWASTTRPWCGPRSRARSPNTWAVHWKGCWG